MLNDQALGGIIEQNLARLMAVVQFDEDTSVGAPQHLAQGLVGVAAALGALRCAVNIVDALDVKGHIVPALKDRECAQALGCDALHADGLDDHSHITFPLLVGTDARIGPRAHRCTPYSGLSAIS